MMGEWEISFDLEYPDRLLWVHVHSEWENSLYACIGDPLACRACQKEIPEEILTLGTLQRIRLERGE